MKKILVTALVCLSALAQAQLTSKEEVAQELVAKREEAKKEITNSYLALKNSLVNSDIQTISTNATRLQNSLKNFRFKKLNLEEMNKATTIRKEIIDLAVDLAEAKDINDQRKFFELLSEKFWSQASKFKATDTMLYLQVCPMTGVKWLSDSEEIKNPYYPKNMLTCGEVKASL